MWIKSDMCLKYQKIWQQHQEDISSCEVNMLQNSSVNHAAVSQHCLPKLLEVFQVKKMYDK
jgi:hypothetical protein